MRIGEQVRYLGGAQSSQLIKGNTYLIEKVETVSRHTLIKLIGVENVFNSNCFEKAVGCIRQAKPLDYRESYDKIPNRF